MNEMQERKPKRRMSDADSDTLQRGDAVKAEVEGSGDSYVFEEPSWVCAGGQYVAPKWIRADLFSLDNL